MDEFLIKRKIYGRKNIGCPIIENSDDQYEYLPINPNDFFIIYLKKIT